MIMGKTAWIQITNIVDIVEIKPEIRVVKNNKIKYYRVIFNHKLSPEIIDILKVYKSRIILRSDGNYELDVRSSATNPDMVDYFMNYKYRKNMNFYLDETTKIYPRFSGGSGSNINYPKLWEIRDCIDKCLKNHDIDLVNDLLREAVDSFDKDELPQFFKIIGNHLKYEHAYGEITADELIIYKATILKLVNEYNIYASEDISL